MTFYRHLIGFCSDLQEKPRQFLAGRVRHSSVIDGSVVLPDTSLQWLGCPVPHSVPARGEQGLVLVGEHDGEHPSSLLWVSRIFRSELTTLVVVVDLPKERLARDLETAEIVLVVRIIVAVEVGKALHLQKRLRFYTDRQL